MSGTVRAGDSCTILVVEDERSIADAVVSRLRSEGYDALWAADGPTAVAVADDRQPALVVLDLNLPGFDGLEVCRRLQRTRRIPTIMLTARDDETDLLVGLGLGADDYLTKPFSMKELTARVRAVLRRAAEPPVGAADRPEHEELVVDLDRRLVRHRSRPVHLTPTEFDLLAALHRADGAVRTRLELLEEVWGFREGSMARTVDSHIRSIRRKTSDDLIRTVHGIGYSLGDLDR